MLILAIAANQFLRPFDQVGTSGFKLVKLMERVNLKYQNPLYIMAHPHSTYAFLRICYPQKRIAIDKDFYGQTPIMVSTPEDILKHKRPWLYLSPAGPRSKPFLIELLHYLKGKTDLDQDLQRLPEDSWVIKSDKFQPQLVDKEENFLIYRLNSIRNNSDQEE